MTMKTLFLSVAMLAIALWVYTAAYQFVCESPAFEAGLRDGYVLRGMFGARAATEAERKAAKGPRSDGDPGYTEGKAVGHGAAAATGILLAFGLLFLGIEISCSKKKPAEQKPEPKPARPETPPPPPPPKKPDYSAAELYRNDGTPSKPEWIKLGEATIPIPTGAMIVACPKCYRFIQQGEDCRHCKAEARTEGEPRP